MERYLGLFTQEYRAMLRLALLVIASNGPSVDLTETRIAPWREFSSFTWEGKSGAWAVTIRGGKATGTLKEREEESSFRFVYEGGNSCTIVSKPEWSQKELAQLGRFAWRDGTLFIKTDKFKRPDANFPVWKIATYRLKPIRR
jgi:hypothetical protein